MLDWTSLVAEKRYIQHVQQDCAHVGYQTRNPNQQILQPVR